MRAVVIFLGAVVAAIALTSFGFRHLFGVRFEMGRAKMLEQGKENDGAPLGAVRAIVPESFENAIPDSVGIHAFNEIYAAIGVRQQDFEQWQKKHGMDSLGVDAGGATLAHGYPVLSRVAWMYVDPVTLTRAETSDLVQECERAILGSASESATHELEAIRALAEKAISKSAVIQFGHP